MSSFWRRSSVPAFFIVLSVVGWCARSVGGLWIEAQYVAEVEERLGYELMVPTAIDLERPAPRPAPAPEPLSEEDQRSRTLAMVRAAMAEDEPLPATWPPSRDAAATPLEAEPEATSGAAEGRALLVAGGVGGLFALIGVGGALLMLRGGRSGETPPTTSAADPGFTDEDVLRAMNEVEDR